MDAALNPAEEPIDDRDDRGDPIVKFKETNRIRHHWHGIEAILLRDWLIKKRVHLINEQP